MNMCYMVTSCTSSSQVKSTRDLGTNMFTRSLGCNIVYFKGTIVYFKGTVVNFKGTIVYFKGTIVYFKRTVVNFKVPLFISRVLL